MAGNTTLYRRLLGTFAKLHQGTTIRFQTLRQAGDQEQLYLEAHNLKGEAGNLGFSAIQSAANLLCQEIKSGAQTHRPELTADLARECEAVLTLLSHLPDTTETPSSAQEGLHFPLDQALPLINQLTIQLKSKNLNARHLAQELADLAQDTELAEEIADITRQVQQLRYEAALTSLAQLLEHHEWSRP